MDKQLIMAEIVSRVGGGEAEAHSVWRIGITHDPNNRRKEWDNPQFWHEWEAGSLMDAQEIESHFINAGMKGGVGGDLTPGRRVWVYIF